MSGQIFLENAEISVSEPDGRVLIPIVRSGDLSRPVTVQYATTTSSAGAADFTGVSGSITIPAGQSRVTVPVTILDDGLSEASEAFTFSIINVSSGTLLFPRTTNVTILDNENPAQDPSEPPLTSDYDVRQIPVISTGLSQPIAFEFLPNNPDLMIVASKSGVISLYNTETGAPVRTMIDLSPVVNNIQDRGLLDIALHPDLQNNPYLYAFYVVDPPEAASRSGNAGPDGGGNRYSHLVRFTLDAATGYTTIAPNSATVILGTAGRTASDISGGGFVDSTSDINAAESGFNAATGEYVRDYLKVDSRSHAGGSIEFGPDGALYVSTGDGTSFNTTDPRSVSVQNLNSLSGKILRIDPITGQGLADNPFATSDLGANVSKVYQLGLRNPFSMGFDKDGRLLITDTGWNNWEEINSGGPGANFGWPFFEGGDNGQNVRANGYRDLPQAAAFYQGVANGQIEITPAFRAFSHASSAPGYQVQAITGADGVIDSNLYPESLRGFYIFTDVSQGEVFAVNANDRRQLEFLFRDPQGFAPVYFKQGPDGQMYYADLASNQIGRLEIFERGNAVNGTSGADYLLGASGIDIMRGNGGQDTFSGSPGNDVIFADATAYSQIDYDGFASDYAIVRNSDGSLTIRGPSTGVDRAFGIDGFWFRAEGRWYAADSLVVSGEPIRGSSGNDVLAGTVGPDIMIGNGGSDRFIFSLGDDVINGNTIAYDQVDYGGRRSDYVFTQQADGSVQVSGAPTGTDTLRAIDGFWFSGEQRWYSLAETLTAGGAIVGTPGNDVLAGTPGPDVMSGNGGSDTFIGSAGDDEIRGNPGAYDQVDYTASRSAYTFVLQADGSVRVTGSPTGTDILRNIDGLWFSGEQRWYAIQDVISGAAGPIQGTPGNDRLVGTSGADVMIGNGGSDVFVGSLGDDDIRGNSASYDQVDYAGARADYTFVRQADGSVRVTSAQTGTDTLRDIDGFWFSGEQRWYGIDQVAPGGAPASAASLFTPVPQEAILLDDSGAALPAPVQEPDFAPASAFELAIAETAFADPQQISLGLVDDPLM